MNLIRWNRQPIFPDLFSDIEKGLFNGNWNDNWMPATNIRDLDNKYEIELAVPGMKKEDFKISLDANLLTISAEKQSEVNEEKDNYSRREFNYGSFSRSFTLPKIAESEGIKAAYEEGILKIEIPKKEEAAKISKEIKVL